MTGRTVYLLEHVHEFDDGHEDVKLIGIYTSEALAVRAKEHRVTQPGFCDLPDGFVISEQVLDDDHAGWPEGYAIVD
jgi:hypothetical protein